MTVVPSVAPNATTIMIGEQIAKAAYALPLADARSREVPIDAGRDLCKPGPLHVESRLRTDDGA